MPDMKRYTQLLVHKHLDPLLGDLPTPRGAGGKKTEIVTRLLELACLARACGLHLKAGREVRIIGDTERGGAILNVRAGRGYVVLEGVGLLAVRLSVFAGELGDEERAEDRPLDDDGALALFESFAEAAP